MIEVRATVNVNDSIKICSLKIKDNRELTIKDLSKLYNFSCKYLKNKLIVRFTYKITYKTDAGNPAIYAGLTQATDINSLDRVTEHIVEHLNINGK